MLKQFLKLHSYKLSIGWALLILALCSMPGRFIPSTTWLEMLSFDKWVHAGIFFILVSLLIVSVKTHQQSASLYYIYFLLAVAYGGALEIMQSTLFSERSADWYDMIANSFGCIIALLLKNKIVKILV